MRLIWGPGRLAGLARRALRRLLARTRWGVSETLLVRARSARDLGQAEVAAALYEEVLRIAPYRARVRIQLGHMRKEAGDFAGAERQYAEARRLAPWDADAALQLGHFYRLAERPDDAADAFRRARWIGRARPAASRELAGLVATADGTGVPAPELLPSIAARPRRRAGISIDRLGNRREPGRLGHRVLRGVEAIRASCTASTEIVEVELWLGRNCLFRATPIGSRFGDDEGAMPRYVINHWHDFSETPPGRHRIELRFRDARGWSRSYRDSVIVDAAHAADDHPDSDALVVPPAGDPSTLDARINALPSMVRPARRSLLAGHSPTILVQRVDQLGDLVVSVPAITRLRALLPAARIVGLVSHANADLARTLGLFDEIVAIDFAEDLSEGRRTMALPAQQALRDRLAPYRFDVAVDLSESSGSRPLLRLSGAPITFGFNEHESPWLSGGFASHMRDRVNGLENTAPSGRGVAMIERLCAALTGVAAVVRRADLDPPDPAEYGIAAGERHAVLHTGARLAYSRWPHFAALAAGLVARTDLKLLVLAEDPEDERDWVAALGPRVGLVAGRLPFDRLDAILSYAGVFVGSDSGLKHLAALRGVPVVSIHMARLNWNEWGQEQTGVIVSRRVPCAGCAISIDPGECGKDFACIRHITPDEVLDAVIAQLG